MKLNYINKYFASDVSVGAQLVLDAGGAVKTMKEFKGEIKQAREDLLNIQNTFGATSKEALNAAKKVAELQDALQDASETAKLFDPGNKFQVLGNTVRGLVGGFTALQGTLALVGVEGENVQGMLLKVQSALALTEGLNVIADVGKYFKRLGSILVQTFGKSGLIGIAIAGVAALGLALSGVFSSKQREDVKAYNDTLQDYNKAAAGAVQKVTEIKIAFDLARDGTIKKNVALKAYNDTLGDSLGKAKSLAEAEKLVADKADTYIRVTGLKAQANALFAKSAQQSADAMVLQDQLAKSGIRSGTFTDVLINKIKGQIEEQKDNAKSIETMAAGLLRQAAQLESKYGVTTGGTNVSTPAAAAAKVENKQIEHDYSTHAEQMLLRQQALQQALKDNRQLFIEEGRELEQAEFDEKIRLLNLEMDAEDAATKRKIQLAEQERQARVQAAGDIGNALGALSELVGRQTAAGKALGIAQAAINMWIGVSEVLRAKSVIPEPFGTIAKIANVATVVATGLNAIKNIAKVQVPGGGGGGAGSLSASAPLTPQPQVATTQLDQRQLNQIGNATVRAFVVESDVANNRERVERLNRAARLG